MKTLKTILILVYVVLAALLVCVNIRCCDRNRESAAEPDIPAEEVADEESVDEALAVGESGDLKVTLSWDFPGDIDLHVMQPNGESINFNRNIDAMTSGQLDVDNRVGGSGAAENIYWTNPPRGTYEIKAHYYSESQGPGHETGSGICRVVVIKKGAQPKAYRFRMDRLKQVANVATVTID